MNNLMTTGLVVRPVSCKTYTLKHIKGKYEDKLSEDWYPSDD